MEMNVIDEKKPWKTFQKAINQANSWTPASSDQKVLFSRLIDLCLDFRFNLNINSFINDGEIRLNYIEQSIINISGQLNLRVKRVKSASDDFLIFYTKEGITDYNGPLFMFRLSECYKIMIISPHNESDGTSIDTVIGFTETKAMWYICNGHKRATNQPERDTTDFIRNNQSLGFHVVKDICEKLRGLIVLHIHGSKKAGVCLLKSRSKQLESVFKAAIRESTNIEIFKAFNAGYALDAIVNTNLYLKTEIPSKTHLANKKIIREIVLDIQKGVMIV